MQRHAVYLKDYKIMFSQFGGIVEYVAKPGQLLKGDLMARVLNVDELEDERATSEVRAPCDLIPILHFPSASVLGEPSCISALRIILSCRFSLNPEIPGLKP